MFKKISEFFRVIGELRYIIPLFRYKWPELDENASLAHTFQDTVQIHGEKNFLYFEDEVWTYAETNKAANMLANKLSNEGIEHGDKVVLFMENRPNFVISLLALNKLGAIGALINTSLTGSPLVHCINTSDSKKCIFGDELSNSLEGVLKEINITKSTEVSADNKTARSLKEFIGLSLPLSTFTELSELRPMIKKSPSFLA